MKKKLVIGSIVLFLAFGIGIYFYMYKNHRDIANEDAKYSVTVKELQSQFNSDAVASDAKYLDKTMNMISYKLIFLFGIVLLTSCSNNSTSDLLDTTYVENPTYTNNIKPIIDHNCIQCHNSPPVNSAPMQLTTYSDVKESVQNGTIIDRISRNDITLMPLNRPRLPQPTIDLIIRWRDQGFQE